MKVFIFTVEVQGGERDKWVVVAENNKRAKKLLRDNHKVILREIRDDLTKECPFDQEQCFHVARLKRFF